ncbi:MAG: tail fiber domain-containing protein, partial [Candidatus Vogelbacteria bacterium]|nr:tail fiber domain-containing protein [Candidatus Vogelbacteria bacterium]
TTTFLGRLAVTGQSVFANLLTAYQTITAPNFVATSSTASVFPYASSTAITVSGTASTTNLIVSSSSQLGTVTSGTWNGSVVGDAYLTKSGNWTGTFDGQEGTYYLNASNLSNFGNPFYTFFSATTTDALVEGSTNKYWSNTLFDNRLSASSSISSITTLPNLSLPASQLSNFGVPFYTFFNGTTTDALAEGSTNKYWSNTLFDTRLSATTSLPNVWSLAGLGQVGSSTATTTGLGNLAVTGGTKLGTLNGILKGINGYVTTALVNLTSDVTGILGISNGGTGTSTAPAYGELLVGNGLGGYSFFATSSLGIIGSGGTGGSNWVYDTNFGADVLTPSSTIPVWFKDPIYASSTLIVDGAIGESYSVRVDSSNTPFGLFQSGDFDQSSLGGIVSQMNDTSGILSLRSNIAITGGDSYIGVRGISTLATSTAFNVGVQGYAKNSSQLNVGGYFASNDTDISDYLALLGVTGSINVGGYFSASSSTAPQNIALLAGASGSSGQNIAGYFTDGDVLINDRLGVGSTTPFAKLSVDGDVRFQGDNFSTTTIGSYLANLVVGGLDLFGQKYAMLTGNAIGGKALILDSAAYVRENEDGSSPPTLGWLNLDGSVIGFVSMSTTTGALNIFSAATTTSSVGFDISDGCYAVAGTCISGGGSSQWTTDGDNVFYVNSNGGNAGILNDFTPTFILGSADGSTFAGMSYSTTSDSLSFSSATGGYGFDNNLTVDTGNYKIETGLQDIVPVIPGTYYLPSITGTSTLGQGLATKGTLFITDGDSLLTSGMPAIYLSDTNNWPNFAIIGFSTSTGQLSLTASTSVLINANTILDLTAGTNINLNGGATTTADTGFDISSGCYAVGGICITGGGSSQWDDVTGGVNYAGGKVGIGSSTPFHTLSVDGNTGIIGSTFRELLVGSNSVNLKVLLKNLSAIPADMPMLSGVTTFAPFYGVGVDSRLNVVDAQSSGASALTFMTNTGGDNATLSYTTSGADTLTFSNASGGYLFNGGNLVVDTDTLYVNSTSNNVGIGTTTPWAKLSVTNTGSGPSFVVEDSTSPDSSPFIIDAAGNVGIGTTSPSTALSVNGIIYSASGGFRFPDGTTQTTSALGSWTTSGNDMYSSNTGNVGIGTSTPGATFAINPVEGSLNMFIVGSSTGGTKFMIDNSGDVAIGTSTSRGHKLMIEGDTMQLYNESGGASNKITSKTGDASTFYQVGGLNNVPWQVGVDLDDTNGGLSKFKINALGFQPNPDLVVKGNMTMGVIGGTSFGTSTMFDVLAVSSDDPRIYLNDWDGTNDSKNWWAGNINNIFTIGTSTAPGVPTTGVTAFAITEAGKVGIGTTTPDSILTLSSTGDTFASAWAATSSVSGFMLGMSGMGGGNLNRWYIEQRPSAIWGGSANSFVLLGQGADNSVKTIPLIANPNGDIILAGATAGTNGNVGIGTTTPSYKLQVAGTGSFGWTLNGGKRGIFIGNEDAYGGTSAVIQGVSSTGGTANIVLQGAGSGFVGISSTTPFKTFSVTGSVAFSPASITTNTGASIYSLCLAASGEMTKNSDAETCIASSIRFKKNVEVLGDSLLEVMDLNPVTFEYKENGNGEHIGFIAEEAEQVNPLLVSYDELGLPNGIRWSHITT